MQNQYKSNQMTVNLLNTKKVIEMRALGHGSREPKSCGERTLGLTP